MKGLSSILAALLLAACGDPCTNTVISELASPDGKHVATALSRDCGATTGFSPQVYLRPTGEPVGNIGNVFVGDHSDKIEITWLSAFHLVISSDCTVIRHETNYRGITIQKREPK